MLKTLTTAAMVAAGLIASPALAQQSHEINFGIISTESAVNLKKNWEPFLEEMSKVTGLKITGFYATDYAGVIEAMRFNKVQVAWYGNKSGMEAVDRSNGEVFAQSVGEDGSLGYYSHVIVSKDSPYTKLEDVLKCDKSLDFGIGDPNSTSGFLVPTSYIFAAKNIDPKECFKVVRNASHEANAMAVANKQVAAATNNSENLQRLQTSAPEAFNKIRVIWTSPIIPLDPIVWRKDLDPAVKTKLQTFFLSYGRVGSSEERARAKTVLGNLLWSPFYPSNDNQLLPIRTLEANKDLMKIQNDSKLSEQEKQQKIAELREKLAKIDELAKKAEDDAFAKRRAAFVVLDKNGNQADLKKAIAEFVSGAAVTN